MRRGGRTQRHGTNDRYCAGGCRCELCRAAHTEAQRAWRRPRHTKPSHGPEILCVGCARGFPPGSIDNHERACLAAA